MALEVSQQSQPEISVMSDMSTINAESALVTEPFEFSVAEITYRACRRTQGILEKLEEEPLPTAPLPTRTPTTTGGKHVAGAKSAGSGETTPQVPARPATQPATMPAADGTGEETSLAFLRNQPVFESMRTEVQKNPALLLEFLHQMERSNPKLLLMISRNPQQFMSMLNETGGESGEGGGGAPEGRSSGERVIHVTQGEKEFIDRTKQQQAKMEEQEEGIPMNQIQAMLKDLKDQIRASLEQRREKLRTELIRLEHTRETISMRLVEEIQLEQEEEERRKNVFKELEAKLAHTRETISMRLVEEIQQLEQEEEERRKILLKKLEATVARRVRRNESRGFIQSLFGFVRGSA